MKLVRNLEREPITRDEKIQWLRNQAAYWAIKHGADDLTTGAIIACITMDVINQEKAKCD